MTLIKGIPEQEKDWFDSPSMFDVSTENPWHTGEVVFMPKGLVGTTLPHRAVIGSEYTRRNGDYVFSVLTPSEIGIPFGTYPRLIIIWLATEAVRTKQREIKLGRSLKQFMCSLGLKGLSGGNTGNSQGFKRQMVSLFSSSMSFYFLTERGCAEQGFRVADQHMIFWSLRSSSKLADWESTVILSEAFYNLAVGSSVPLCMKTLVAIKQSSMTTDIYCWLTYRMFSLEITGRSTLIPWGSLAAQFGSSYAELKCFKNNFKKKLNKVSEHYPEARYIHRKEGLLLLPSPPHVPRAHY